MRGCYGAVGHRKMNVGWTVRVLPTKIRHCLKKGWGDMKRLNRAFWNEVLIGLGYSLGGSLGLCCLLQFMAMALDSHLPFPYRKPISLIMGLLSLIWCMGLLYFDCSRKGEWKRWQQCICRICVVCITFMPLLIMWLGLFELGDLLIGID